MAKKPVAEELFYEDEDGNKSDADIHNHILSRFDPIDEKIMKPIRDRHRAQYYAAHRTKSWKRLKEKLLAKYDPNQPREPAGSPGGTGGQFAGGAGGEDERFDEDQTSASVLLELPTMTPDELIDSIPGAREAVEDVRSRLKDRALGVPTDASVLDGGHKLANGDWTPQRQAIHREIVDKLMTAEDIAAATPKPGEKPVLHILGGRGGSGKGWFTDTKKGGTVSRAGKLYLNSDDVKGELPEWQGWNAPHLHEESSYVGGKMEKFARERKLNVIIDATLKSSLTTKARIEAFKAAGYRIEGHYMQAQPQKAAERALGRFTRGMQKNGKGRFVAPEYSMTSLTNEQSFDRYRKDMDYWEIYDNNGDEPKLHSKKK